MLNKQSGFGIVPAVLSVLCLVILFFAGWRVYRTGHNSNLSNPSPTLKTVKSQCGTLKYPANWTSSPQNAVQYPCTKANLTFISPTNGPIKLYESDLKGELTHTRFSFQISQPTVRGGPFNDLVPLTDLSSPARSCTYRANPNTACQVEQVIPLSIAAAPNAKLVVYTDKGVDVNGKSFSGQVHLAISDDPNLSIGVQDFDNNFVISGNKFVIGGKLMARIGGAIEYQQAINTGCSNQDEPACVGYENDPNHWWAAYSLKSFQSFESTPTFKEFVNILNSWAPVS